MSTYTPTAEEIAVALQRLREFTTNQQAGFTIASAEVWTLCQVISWLGHDGEPTPGQIRQVRAAIAAKMQWSREFTIADR